MRQVKFKKYIPAEWPEGTNSTNQGTPGHYPIKGSAQYEDGFSEDGTFHEWGTDLLETETGAASYTVAIIERPDGTIHRANPEHVKFQTKCTAENYDTCAHWQNQVMGCSECFNQYKEIQ